MDKKNNIKLKIIPNKLNKEKVSQKVNKGVVSNKTNNINKNSVPDNVSEEEILKNIHNMEKGSSNVNNKRRNMIYIIIFGILLLSILFSASYAYFSVDTTNTNKLGNIIGNIDCVGVVYSESGTIDLDNSTPVTDEYALANYTPVTVTVTNNCSNQQSYYFTFSSLANATGYIPDNKVNIAVEKRTGNNSFYRIVNPKYVSYLVEVPETNSFKSTLMADLNRRDETKSYTNKKSYVLDHDYISSGETKTYKVYLWIDYYEGDETHTGLNNNTTQGLLFKGSLGIVPVNYHSLAKHIELNSGYGRTIYGDTNDGDGNPRKVTDECSASGCNTVNIQSANQYIYYYYNNTTHINAIFGGYCWKIVRTTTMGGVKLLYNGVPTTVDDHLECANDSDTINNNAVYKFNSTGVATANKQTPASVGYMYNVTTGTLGDMLQADDVNKYDSEIKTVLDAWYTSWVTNNNVDEDKLEAAVYCNDRTLGVGSGSSYLTATLNNTLDTLTNGKSYVFSGFNRNTDSSGANKSFGCTNVTDSFSINNPKAGGSNMKNIGLMTLDEALALNTNIIKGNNTIWLMTPYLIRKESATSYYTRIFRNTTSGGIDNDRSHQTQKVRPVITVNSTVYSTGGDGTITNPYILS